VRFVELLTKFGNFDLVRIREKNPQHGDPASRSDPSQQCSTCDG
jgi:hypothetical protein